MKIWHILIWKCNTTIHFRTKITKTCDQFVCFEIFAVWWWAKIPAKILILDDSTSAVDTATDAKIRTAFSKEIPNTTKIIIAQRISSVQDADKIIVLDDGKISGVGTHEELLENNEIYADVYNSQVKGDDDEYEVAK